MHVCVILLLLSIPFFLCSYCNSCFFFGTKRERRWFESQKAGLTQRKKKKEKKKASKKDRKNERKKRMKERMKERGIKEGGERERERERESVCV